MYLAFSSACLSSSAFSTSIFFAISANSTIGAPLMIAYFIFPILIECAVLTALYIIVPRVRVKFQDALLGAIFVTVVFEVSKKLFSLFILNFSNYEAIYGAIAAIPVLFVWIYISWWIVLIGAEFTASLGVVRSGLSDEVPSFMVYLANATGSTLGSDNLISSKAHKPAININVSVNKRKSFQRGRYCCDLFNSYMTSTSHVPRHDLDLSFCSFHKVSYCCF